MNEEYENNGFIRIQSLFKEEELQKIRCLLEAFHQKWLEFADTTYLPNEDLMQKLDSPTLFGNTLLLKGKP